MMCPYRACVGLLPFCLALLISSSIRAEVPLHERIDSVLTKSQVGPSAPLAGDAEFLRRIYLDLTGRIPSTEAARKFLEDKSPDKRQKLVDQLLGSPASNRHLAKVFDVMLMERRSDKHVKKAEWDAYLLSSIQENKPYNQLAREILAADGVDPKKRAPVKFYLDRDDMAVNLVTRDAARVFFGRDIECAQCHDHPLISDYEQQEYYGILAFLNRSSLFQADKKKPAMIAEKAEGSVKFKSVFTGYEGATLPRLPGEEEIVEPTFKKGEEYQVKPAKNVRPVPKFSRRQKFGELATSGTNEAFNKNIANRLWAVMMGRGLVEPVDLHHSENPPASPELLDLLTQEFVAMNFDIKAFLKQVALSNTYQRSFRLPDSFADNLTIARQELPKLEEQKKQFEQMAASFDKPLEEIEATRKTQLDTAKPLKEKAKSLQTQIAALEKKQTATKAALMKLQQPLAANQDVAKLLVEAAKQSHLAAQKLPADKALIEANAAIQAQSNTWQQKVAALKKPFDQQTVALKKLDTELAAIQSQAKQNQVALRKTEEQIAQTETKRQSVRNQQKAARNSAEATGRRSDRLKLLTQYAATSEQLQKAKTAVQAIQTELTSVQVQAAQKADALAQAEQQKTDAKKTHAEKGQSLSAIKGELAKHTQAAQLIVEALAQMETAQKQLPKDTELAVVIDHLQTARETQTNQKSAIEQQSKEMDKAVQAASAQMVSATKAITELTAALKTFQTTTKELTSRQKTLEADLVKAEGVVELAQTELAESWTKHFRVAGVEHLSPEQLAWSVLEATGQVQLQQNAALSAWNKKHADLAKKELTPEQQKDQAEFIEQTVHAKVAGLVAKFLPLFAASSGQPQHEFFATVDQALFFSNGSEVSGWLRPSGDNLTARLKKLAEPQQIAEELYLSILARRPTAEETKDVASYLGGRKDEKDKALTEMAWALLTSAEFRFQH